MLQLHVSTHRSCAPTLYAEDGVGTGAFCFFTVLMPQKVSPDWVVSLVLLEIFVFLVPSLFRAGFAVQGRHDAALDVAAEDVPVELAEAGALAAQVHVGDVCVQLVRRAAEQAAPEDVPVKLEERHSRTFT